MEDLMEVGGRGMTDDMNENELITVTPTPELTYPDNKEELPYEQLSPNNDYLNFNNSVDFNNWTWNYLDLTYDYSVIEGLATPENASMAIMQTNYLEKQQTYELIKIRETVNIFCVSFMTVVLIGWFKNKFRGAV